MAELTYTGRGNRGAAHVQQQTQQHHQERPQQTPPRPSSASPRIQSSSPVPGGLGTRQPSARQMLAFLDAAEQAGANQQRQQPSLYPPSESFPDGILGPKAPPADRSRSRPRPKSASAVPLRTSGRPRVTTQPQASNHQSPTVRQFGRASLYDHDTPEQPPHGYPGPKVLRDLSRPHLGFPHRPPEDFLRAGEGLDLRQRNKLRQHLQRHPVNREPPFQPGTGGVRMPPAQAATTPSPRQPHTADPRRPQPPPPPQPRTLLRTYYDNGTLDFVAVRWRGNRADALVWSRQVMKGSEGSALTRSFSSWGPELPAELPLHTWLPIFIDGVREYDEPYRFLAVRGSEDFLYKAGDTLHTFADSLVAPFKSLLDSREPTCVAVALQLMSACLAANPAVAAQWVPHYWQFAQVINLFRSRGGSLAVNMGYNKRAIATCRDLATSFMTAFEIAGGPAATAAVRRYSPGFDPAVTDASMARAASKAAARAREAGLDSGEFKPFTLF